MTSILLACVLWAENPPAKPSPSIKSRTTAAAAPATVIDPAEAEASDGKSINFAPKATPNIDRYGRTIGSPARTQPPDAESAETEAEAAQIAEEGGPSISGAPRSAAAAKGAATARSNANPAEMAPLKRDASAGQTPLAPVQAPATKTGEAEALIRSLANPSELALPGASTPLVDLMSRLIDRRQQIDVAQAYWKLWAAVAEYRIAADSFARLQQFVPPAEATGQPPADPLVEARLLAAEARLRESEAEVLANQYALAELAHWPASAELPLPADIPHSGGYLTRFDRVYSNAPPPPRAVLIDRSLPLRHRSVEMRAAAVTAAAHAAEGDFDAFAQGKTDLMVALDSIFELGRQQRAFVLAVRDYNRDIAEYALSIAPPGLPGGKLVGMLITTPVTNSQRRQGDASFAEQPDGVRRAGFDQPATRIRSAAPPAAQKLGEPAAAAADASAPSSNVDSGAEAADEPGVEAGPVDEPNVPSGPSGEPARPLDPSEKRPANAPGSKFRADPFSARKPPLDADAGAMADPPMGLYPALVDLTPPQRTQELGTTLHWVHQLPGETGARVGLAECLSWVGADADRRTMIETYWQTCHRLARFQAMTQEAEQLQSLDPAALRWRTHADGAEAMLRLKAAQRGVQADLAEAELDLRIGQFLLAQLGRRPLTGAWPLPENAPHAGRFRMKLESQPEAIQQLRGVRRLAGTISLLYGALEQESAAVVQADLLRADAIAQYERGEVGIGTPLDAIRTQLEETLAFLKMQADYNLQYADYVLAVLPPGAGNDLLAKALVFRRQNG